MNKRFLTFLIATVSLISACEIDDICVEPTTPNLVLRFYDATSTTTIKATDSLYIWAEGKDSLYLNEAVDSIAIPLNPLTSETVYNLSQGTLLLNKLTITYTPEEEFTSRSCGYRFTYKDVSLSIDSPSNSWISSLTPTTIPSITNQDTAHVQVFH
ncbi:DUF6452 family protein [Tenacibaculum aquimarinum]|uniref:DUF6452 family protein n=1 Tax=Tenacibaculum aquimarinum TaxID=2910675 RepID=UPI001F0A5970|nr:DUF6452 family protein [Tenacibaculum aquimarinum]MCH3884932.1 DUF6452 family protein [Tenacibaculum aquimarinum]